MKRNSLVGGRLLAAFCAAWLVLSACTPSVPPEPTIAVLPTAEPTIEPTVAPTLTPTPEFTWTPLPTAFIPPTAAPSATIALSPLQQTAQAPITAVDSGEVKVITISEAQLNAALASAHQSSPLTGYVEPPRVVLSDGALQMALRILPATPPPGSRGQPVTLVADLESFEGKLELMPSQLTGLENSGVTTLQVKLAHRAVIREIEQLLRASTGRADLVVRDVLIVPGKVTLTVAAAGR